MPGAAISNAVLHLVVFLVFLPPLVYGCPAEEPMYRMKLFVLAAIVATSAAMLAQTPAVTVFEGARVIIGDGRAPIENATFIVSGNRFTQVGRAGDLKVPAGATRVNLAGKTVM